MFRFITECSELQIILKMLENFWKNLNLIKIFKIFVVTLFFFKGVVLTHGNLSAMIDAMTSAWAWSSGDVILHVLPLHHVHGIINALLTPLCTGATCLMLPKFDPHKVLL